MITHLLEKTNTVLRFLGITRNTVTYPILCQAIELIDEDKNRLLAVEKQIYSPIADNHYCYPKGVQSAVCRASKKAWETLPERVQQLAGYPLSKAPSAAPFLEMIYNTVESMDYSIRSDKIYLKSVI